MFNYYTTKKYLEIDLFFQHVSWWRLLVRVWKIIPTVEETRAMVFKIRSREKEIKKVWKNNLELSLPQVLISMEIIPFNIIKSNSNYISDWYFMDIPNMMYEMEIPKCLYTIERKTTWFFGIKRKHPIYKLKKVK